MIKLQLTDETIVNNMVQSCQAVISHLNTEIANIKETYRKLCEEAEENLQKQLEEAKRQHHYWLVVRGDLPETEKKTRKPRTKKSDTVAEEPVAETETVESSESTPELDGAGFTEADNEPIEETVVDPYPEDESVSESVEESVPVSDEENDINSLWEDASDETETPAEPEVKEEPVIIKEVDDFSMPIEW